MSRRIMLKFGCLAAVVAALGLSTGRVASVNLETKTSHLMPEARGEVAVKHLKQAGLYDSLYQAVQATRYQVKEQAGGYRAANPAHNYVTHFTADGIRVKATGQSNSAWRLGMRLSGYGYGARKVEVGPGQLTASNNEVAYERRAKDGSGHKITEWYVNRPTGIEQGFTIPSAPGEKADGERLTLRLELSGNLGARLEEAGEAITLSGGGAELRYDHLYAYDARGQALGARMSLSGKELRLEVDDEMAVYPVTIDPLLTQQKLTASDAAAGDAFGFAVAISGGTAVVGAPFDDNPGPNSGSAYVFVLTGTTWTQQQKLTPSDGAAGDQFGISVAIDGETVVVGASLDDRPGAVNSGSAYVFVRSGVTWTQEQKLTASDGAADDQFGNSVAIDNDTAVVTAFQNAAPLFRSGSAYVYVRSETTWSLQQKLTTSDAATNDRLGFSSGISLDTIVLGAQDDDSPTFNSGSAYVFARVGTTWTQQQRLTASDGASNDLFGHSVAISGVTIVVGAIWDDDAGLDAGSAYVYVRTGTTWSQQQKLLALDAAAGDNFGESVAVSGNKAVVGSPGDDDAGSGSGSVYIFARIGTTWGQMHKLTASDAAGGDGFGESVAVDDVTVVVGAPGNDDAGSNSGSAYVTKTGALVDLSIEAADVAALPNQSAVRTIIVENGFESTTGPVDVTIFTAPFVNFDDSVPLPPGCSFVFQNPAPAFPEAVVCTIPSVASGQTVSIQLAIKPTAIAPEVMLLGMAMALPAASSNDVETFITDNDTRSATSIGHSGSFIATGEANLYIRGDTPAITQNGSATMTMVVGNNGPAATTGQAVFTMTTPFFVNFGTPLPTGCTKVLEDPRPNFPEIVQCNIAGSILPNTERQFVLPLTLVPGGSDNMIWGNAAVTLSTVDPDRTDNYFLPSLLVLEPDVISCQQASSSATPKRGNRDYMVAASRKATRVLSGASGKSKVKIPSSIKPGSFAAIASGFAPGARGYRNLDVNKQFLQAAIDRRMRQGLAPPDSEQAATGKVTIIPPKLNSPAAAKGNLSNLSGKSPAAKSSLQAGGRVDLNLVANATDVIFGADRSATMNFTVGNRGENATGNVRLIYVTPPLVNIDRNRPLPGACEFLFPNQDFEISEIIQCVVPGPQTGQTISLPVPIVYADEAPSIPLGGQAIVVPVAGSPDREQFINDNLEFPTLGIESGIIPGSDQVNLFVTSVFPNIRTDKPATVILNVGNRGAVATQAPARLVFTTPMYVNIDRNRPLPSGCSFLFQNTDPNIPEVVQCIAPAPIQPCGAISFPIPVVVLPGAPTGMHTGTMIVRSQNPQIDINPDLTQSFSIHGVTISSPPQHDVKFFLHGDDIPRAPSGEFIMNQTPGPSRILTLDLLTSPSWLSDPALVGTFAPGAAFTFTVPCTLGLNLGVTFTLSSTDLNGGDVRLLGQAPAPLLCLGTQTVTIPVPTPLDLNQRRLKLTISTAVRTIVNLQVGPGSFLKGTLFSGTP